MKRLLVVGLMAVALGSLQSAAPVAGTETISFLLVLLDQQGIRQDLKLSRLQEARMDAIRAEARAKIGVVSAAGLLDPALASSALKNLSVYQATCNRRIQSTLTPEQQLRLRQIERQFHGGLFLLSPGEQDLLKLSADQRRKIDEIRAVDSAKAAELQKAFASGKKSVLRRDLDLHRLRRTTARSLLHLLTPAQKREWLASLGAPLNKQGWTK